MKIKLNVLSALAFASVVAANVRAADDSEALESHFETSFSEVLKAVNAADENSSAAGEWTTEMKVFHLNVSPYVSFGVKDFADVTIAPEIEFIFEKNEE